jgi:hypothetical protein
MFTLSVIILAVLGAAVILFRICEAITVESYTISACDFLDEGPRPASDLETGAAACASSQPTAAAWPQVTSKDRLGITHQAAHQRFGGNP